MSEKPARAPAEEKEETGKDDDDAGDDPAEDDEEAERDWAALRRPEGWFLETGLLSDVTVMCGGRSYSLHKMVLCRESEWFHQTLLGEDKEESPTLDFEEEDFEGFCAMMYNTGIVGKTYEQAVMETMMASKISAETSLRICSIADELGCPQVVLNVRFFFHQTLDASSAIPFLKGSWELPHLKYFKTLSLEVMVKSFESYLGDDNIGLLPVEAMCEVMRLCAERKPRAPPAQIVCSIGCLNLVHQDQQRNVNRNLIKACLALIPAIGFAEVCDILLLCAKHGAEQEMERCIPVLASFLPNVQRDKALAVSRKVLVDALRHEALADIDHAYTFGKDFLYLNAPEIKAMVDNMDRKGTTTSSSKVKRPRVGTEEWYSLEILDTLAVLRNRIKKRDMEIARNLPSFSVLIICAEAFGDYREDVRLKLVDAGCTQVECVLAHLRTPSFEQIRNFHSVLVWSNAEFDNSEALGDVLADAADEGVGVVLCAYAMKLHDKKIGLAGRLASQYLPVAQGYIAGGEELTLRPYTKGLEDHPEVAPILEGVTQFSGGSESMHLTVEKKVGLASSVTVAMWSNNHPAVVVNLPAGRRRGKVVIFNGRPGSSSVSAHGWTGQGQRLMFNMLKFATATKTEAKCLV